MNAAQIEKMKALALAATPGPWHGFFDGVRLEPSVFGQKNTSRYVCGVMGTMGRNEPEHANARFIAAANPAAVLELIAEVERLRAAANVRETPLYLAACRMGNTLYNISQHDDLPSNWKATCREMVNQWDEARKEIGSGDAAIGAHAKAGKEQA